MGIFDSIVNIVKKVYNTVDKTLGGVLPGGQTSTPTPVSTPTSSNSFVTPGSVTNPPKNTINVPTSQAIVNEAKATGANPIDVASTPQPVVNSSSGSNINRNTSRATSTPTPVSTPTTPTPTSAPAPEQQASSGTRNVSIRAKDGTLTTYYGLDPNQSVISQTGQYEFDFFTEQGQKERLLNALETTSPRLSSTAIGGQYIPGVSEATTVAIDALNVAALLDGAQVLFKTMQSMNKVGSLVMGGAEASKVLTSTIPEATGFLEEGAITTLQAGKVIKNTVTSTGRVNFIRQLATKIGFGNEAAGWIASMAGLGYAVSSQQVSTENQISSYIDDSKNLQVKLIEAGMNDMADELAQSNKDLRDGLDAILPYIPYLGTNIEKNKVIEYSNKLKDIERELNAKKKDIAMQEATNKLLTAQQEVDATRQQNLTDLADKRAYDAQVLADKRNYEQQQTQEQRNYNEQQQIQQQQQGLFSEATAVEGSGSSTLNFGLLNSGGDIQFVDRDKASKAYFGKTFEELTPAQKKLLMLSKGMK